MFVDAIDAFLHGEIPTFFFEENEQPIVCMGVPKGLCGFHPEETATTQMPKKKGWLICGIPPETRPLFISCGTDSPESCVACIIFV